MPILLECAYFNTFLKCQQNFTTVVLCAKHISSLQNQLSVPTYILETGYIYIVIARALLSKYKNYLPFKIYTENKYM